MIFFVQDVYTQRPRMTSFGALQISNTIHFTSIFISVLLILRQDAACCRGLPCNILRNIEGALKYVSTTRQHRIPLEVRALCLSRSISVALKDVFKNYTIVMESSCLRPKDYLHVLFRALAGGHRSFVALCEEPFAKDMARVLHGRFELASVATFVVVHTSEFQAGACSVFKPLRNSFVSVTTDGFLPCSYENRTYCTSSEWFCMKGEEIVVGCGFIDSAACDKPSGRAVLNALAAINASVTKKHPRGTISLIESGIDVSLSFGSFHFAGVVTSVFPTITRVTELWYIFRTRPEPSLYNSSLSPHNFAFGSVLLRLGFICGASWGVLLFLQLLYNLQMKEVLNRAVRSSNAHLRGSINQMFSNKPREHFVGFSCMSWALGSLFVLFYAQCLITSTAIVPLKREAVVTIGEIESLFDRNPACICTDYDTFLHISHQRINLTRSVRFTIDETGSCQTPDLLILPDCLKGVSFGNNLAIVPEQVKCDLERRFGIEAVQSDEPVATIFESTPVRPGFQHVEPYSALVRRIFETGWLSHEESLLRTDSCLDAYYERPLHTILAATVLVSGSISAACICFLEHVFMNHFTIRGMQ